MTRDEVIRLAEQASCGWIKNGTEPALFGENQLERFAALVAAHERGRMCEQFGIPEELAHEKAKGDEKD